MTILPPIAIFGASSFANKIADIGTILGHDAFVFLRPVGDAAPTDVSNWPVRPETDAPALRQSGHVFALGIGDGAIRKKVAAAHAELPFVNIVHPAATFGSDRDAVQIREVQPGRDSAGDSWLGLRRNDTKTVVGVSDTPLLPALLSILIALGGLMFAWRREGR